MAQQNEPSAGKLCKVAGIFCSRETRIPPRYGGQAHVCVLSSTVDINLTAMKKTEMAADWEHTA